MDGYWASKLSSNQFLMTTPFLESGWLRYRKALPRPPSASLHVSLHVQQLLRGPTQDLWFVPTQNQKKIQKISSRSSERKGTEPAARAIGSLPRTMLSRNLGEVASGVGAEEQVMTKKNAERLLAMPLQARRLT